MTEMVGPRVFMSFANLPDVSAHRRYNEWHQLDHQPENLRLPGVAWAERWVHSPDCAQLSKRSGHPLESLHYLNMYWFGEPAQRSIAEFNELAHASLHWGRRRESRTVDRLLVGFFKPLKGYVNRRIAVSADVLPFRPNRGVFVTVARVRDDADPANADAYHFYDEIRLPDIVECAGVAGAWTFVNDPSYQPPSGSTPTGTVRVHLHYLDEDPVEVFHRLDLAAAEWEQRGRDFDASSTHELLFAGVLRSITPWQWDWFDEQS